MQLVFSVRKKLEMVLRLNPIALECSVVLQGAKIIQKRLQNVRGPKILGRNHSKTSSEYAGAGRAGGEEDSREKTSTICLITVEST